MDIQLSQNGEITVLFIDIGKSCFTHNFFYMANMSFNAIREIKILTESN